MKRLGFMLCCIAAVWFTAYAMELLPISTRKQRFPEKNLLIERTYRGRECIMFEMTEGGQRTRAFRVNGKTVAAESDEDGDGFYENFVVFDPESGDFEWFIRTTNHVVRPVASEKLQEVKDKKRRADKALSELMHE